MSGRRTRERSGTVFMPSCYASEGRPTAMLAMRFDNDSLPVMFEPEAEAMPTEQLRALQIGRLRGLIDRLLAAGGLQATRLAAGGRTPGAEVSREDLARRPPPGEADLWASDAFG